MPLRNLHDWLQIVQSGARTPQERRRKNIEQNDCQVSRSHRQRIFTNAMCLDSPELRRRALAVAATPKLPRYMIIDRLEPPRLDNLLRSSIEHLSELSPKLLRRQIISGEVLRSHRKLTIDCRRTSVDIVTTETASVQANTSNFDVYNGNLVHNHKVHAMGIEQQPFNFNHATPSKLDRRLAHLPNSDAHFTLPYDEHMTVTIDNCGRHVSTKVTPSQRKDGRIETRDTTDNWLNAKEKMMTPARNRRIAVTAFILDDNKEHRYRTGRVYGDLTLGQVSNLRSSVKCIQNAGMNFVNRRILNRLEQREPIVKEIFYKAAFICCITKV